MVDLSILIAKRCIKKMIKEVKISTNIPLELAQKRKELGYSWKELIIAGFYKRQNEPNISTRLDRIEHEIDRNSDKIRQLLIENHKLQKDIEVLKNE